MAEISDPRLIAFYLPQFHPIPENDAWWGKGFTDWRNVVNARPQFHGHYQPHLPADLGFYDLRVAELREAQAELAREHGISGFCYYHYWFNGRRLLEKPFNDVLVSGRPDLPFCLCWANEKWTRGWDGREQEILMHQTYSAADDRAHIRSLFPVFADSRYIKIDGKPLFLVYRSEDLPDARCTSEVWREEALSAGIGDLFLARVESITSAIDPRSVGFDAAVEFAPDWRNKGELKIFGGGQDLMAKFGLLSKAYTTLQIADYVFLMNQMLKKPWPDYDFFRCVTPGFDNTPRRSERATIFVNAGPDSYEQWMRRIVEDTRSRYQGDRRLVFVNAWNEWGEGSHLEPDQKYGHAFLKATARVLVEGNSQNDLDVRPNCSFPGWKKAYWKGRKVIKEVGGVLRNATFKSC